MGDGSTDDTVSIRSAITAAKAAGKEVYFPNGSYIISGNISIPDNTSILGDKSGISLIKAVIAAVVLGALSGARVENFSIEDMFFLKNDIEMTFQYTSDLSDETAWSDVVIGATSSGPDPNGVLITVEESDFDPDFIQITLPIGFDRRIFGRIRVSVTH